MPKGYQEGPQTSHGALGVPEGYSTGTQTTPYRTTSPCPKPRATGLTALLSWLCAAALLVGWLDEPLLPLFFVIYQLYFVAAAASPGRL